VQFHRSATTVPRRERALRRRPRRPDHVEPQVSIAEDAPAPPPVAAPEPAPAPRAHPAALTHAEHEIEGASLLLADLRTVFLLCNEARHRTLERLFGLPRDQANLVTVIGAGLLAHAAHEKLGRLLKPRVPSVGEIAFSTAASRELLLGAKSAATPDVPVFGALIAFVVVGRVGLPAVIKSARGTRAAIHGTRMAVKRRYGHAD
jgi:hypothetical protein